MKTKLKKWHIMLMSFLALFIAVFASMFSLRADTVDEETGEILTDNWSIDVVFYDSTVDNGTTPLTSIDWKSTDAGYGTGTPRIITVHINYKNDNAVTTYQPGEIIFSIPNLIYSNGAGTATDAQWTTTTTIDANFGNNSGEFWDFVPNVTPDTTQEFYSFSNAEVIEAEANFQGSIQIQYTITPQAEIPEPYLDKCVHNYSKDLTVSLMSGENTIESNVINFAYTRTYEHEWAKEPYTLTKSATKLTSMDGFPEGTNNYYWVKYSFVIDDAHNLENGSSSTYPYITASQFYIEDTFTDGCIVLNSTTLTELTPINGNTYQISYEGSFKNKETVYIYVGYPRSTYNEDAGNLAITNTAYLYSKYLSDTEYTYSDDATVSLNLSNFEFQYSGNLYSIGKDITSRVSSLYQALTNEDSTLANYATKGWKLNFSTKYSGDKYDVHVGDDLLFITDTDGTYRKLTDDEYSFTSVSFPVLKNGSGQTLTEKYLVQLYIREKNSSSYELYTEFLNTSKSISLTDKNVVAFYFVIKDVVTDINTASIVITTKTNNVSSLAENGYLYNFDYIEIYKNGVLANTVTESSYSSSATKMNIATYDIQTYNHYRQRSYDYIDYFYYYNPKTTNKQYIYKLMSETTKNAEEQIFAGTATIRTNFGRTDLYSTTHSGLNISPETYVKYSGETFNYEDGNTGFVFYDLLPSGMNLISSPEEIINSVGEGYSSWGATYLYDMYKNHLTMDDLFNKVKENMTVIIDDNWNNTGRTLLKITVDWTDNPIYYLYFTTNFSSDGCGFGFSYNYSVSYDAFLEYGSVWKNRIYLYGYDNAFEYDTYSDKPYITTDNGSYDLQETDINQNGDTTEIVGYSSSTATINHVISTHQDVTKYVKTEYSDYATGTVDSPCDAEYQYKLRVRTGQNDITNLIIYDNLETAQPERQRWQGEFLGIDTSFAEARTYKLLRPNDPNADTNGYISYNIKINPYYSENPTAGNLYNEDGTLNSDWKVFVPHYEETHGNGMAITFNENFKTYNSDDYLCIYYYYNNVLFCSPKYSGTDLAGKTIEIPALDCYFYWYTSATRNTGYGFSIDDINPVICNTVLGTNVTSLPAYQAVELSGNNYPETPHNPYRDGARDLWHYTLADTLVQEYVEGTDRSKVKALAFEYVNTDGTAAIIPANNMTYVFINMKSPEDESITTLARNNCRTQWNAIDEFGVIVNGITGINSNVVKVALPNSIDEDSNPSLSLRFTKEINGTDSEFENMKLDKAAQQVFMIKLTSLTANDDGSYNQITALLKSEQELIISQIPVGTYLLEELGDNYFDFVEFTNNNDPEITIEGVTFEKTDQGYIITVSEDLTENIEFNIKVTNEIEDKRFYEDNDNKENLFLKNKIEEES